MRALLIIIAVATLNPVILFAQRTVRTRYEHSRRIHSEERWNKRNTVAHFYIYSKRGTILAEGYKRRVLRRRYEFPVRFFVAYNDSGKLIQRMRQTPDSVTLYTFDDGGTLREYFVCQSNRYRYERYFQDGKRLNLHEGYLPDSLSYFRDYYYPDKWVKQHYQVSYPRPLWPFAFGVSGFDGISAPNTFKVYYRPDTEEPHCRTRGSAITWDSSGKVTCVIRFPYQ